MKKLFIPFLFVFVLLFGIQSYFILQNASQYKEAIMNFTQENDLGNTVDQIIGWFQGEEEQAMTSVTEDVEVIRQSLNLNSLLLGIEFILFLVISYFTFCKRQFDGVTWWISLMVIAGFSLILGVFVPTIELNAYGNEFDLGVNISLGKDIFFFHQCKSIIDLVIVLFTSQNYVIGILIVLFSIVFPLTKLIFTVAFLLGAKFSARTKKIISKIGKWSMADVFIVSIFLAIFSFKNIETGIETSSMPIVGLYFFILYCLISIYSSKVFKKS